MTPRYLGGGVQHEASRPRGQEASAGLPDPKGMTPLPDGTRARAPHKRMTEAEFDSCELTSVEDSTDEECATDACPVR